MIVVLATIHSSEEDIQALRQAIIDVESATLTEPGNLSYSFNVSISDPDKIQIVETWETIDALAAHLTTPHVAAFQGAVAANPPKGMEAHAYDVAKEVEIPMPQ